jgi:hypothetical protein
MPTPTLTTEMKKVKGAHDSLMEFARLRDAYLFDEVALKKISHEGLSGVRLDFEYTRHGHALKDLQPLYVTEDNWAAARKACDGDVTKFAATPLVQRLFADGSRQFNQREDLAKADFLKDQDFIAQIKDAGANTPVQ